MKARGVLVILLVAFGVVSAVAWWVLQSDATASEPSPRSPTLVDDPARVSLQGGQRVAATEEEEPEPAAGQRASAVLGAEPDVPARAASGSIRGLVMDELGAPVPKARVTTRRGSTQRECEVGGLGPEVGTFAFEELPPGRYQLFVEPRSLGGHYLAPWGQQVARPYEGTPTGFGGTVVFLTEDEEAVVDLRVFRPARIVGRVLDEDGRPLANAVVQLASTDGVIDAGATLKDGTYEIGRMYPGAYTACVLRVSGKECGPRAPLPVSFRLSAGESRSVPDLRLGTGELTLAGRIVDVQGEGVSNMRVECRQAEAAGGPEWHAVSDEEGRYEFGGLVNANVVVSFDGRIAVRFGNDQTHASGLGTIAPIEADLRFANGRVELADVVLEDREPFFVNGRLEIDESWAEENDLGAFHVRLVAGEPGATERMAAAGWSRFDGRYDAKRKTFTWLCRTPSDPVELAVVLVMPGGGTEVRTVLVEPRSGARENVVVSFP